MLTLISRFALKCFHLIYIFLYCHFTVQLYLADTQMSQQRHKCAVKHIYLSIGVGVWCTDVHWPTHPASWTKEDWPKEVRGGGRRGCTGQGRVAKGMIGGR